MEDLNAQKRVLVMAKDARQQRLAWRHLDSGMTSAYKFCAYKVHPHVGALGLVDVKSASHSATWTRACPRPIRSAARCCTPRAQSCAPRSSTPVLHAMLS
eukprot:2034076-Rhodomonas_salina.3